MNNVDAFMRDYLAKRYSYKFADSLSSKQLHAVYTRVSKADEEYCNKQYAEACKESSNTPSETTRETAHETTTWTTAPPSKPDIVYDKQTFTLKAATVPFKPGTTIERIAACKALRNAFAPWRYAAATLIKSCKKKHSGRIAAVLQDYDVGAFTIYGDFIYALDVNEYRINQRNELVVCVDINTLEPELANLGLRRNFFAKGLVYLGKFYSINDPEIQEHCRKYFPEAFTETFDPTLYSPYAPEIVNDYNLCVYNIQHPIGGMTHE